MKKINKKLTNRTLDQNPGVSITKTTANHQITIRVNKAAVIKTKKK